MTLQSPQAIDGDIFSSIKELSGKLVERWRRRDRISQRSLGKSVGRTERWIRELEGGAGTASLEDHIRCAHALRRTSSHLFIFLLAVEQKMAVPHELLLLDDLWELERDIVDVVSRHQAAAVARLASRGGPAVIRPA
ncbi:MULTISPECIES: transcriptional regulator [Sphingobium]|uniref:Transcriptional regulator n=1 Tax=Sphingobium cupriresistens TaxID=1132417 RepID=A0A8G2DV04_9SPHN|nr:transcriptional regulator [Sphingobium cupriresistens]MDF0544987.1 transcriptional regulator [Sphingobium arseniciresistens]RYM09253.1 transcriptional regulator [Sphingobium cupriresistens]|tara:strand:+ start:40569 stop:40979 length:411 start_codon:yes stop_codon:yes gene_type:complete